MISKVDNYPQLLKSLKFNNEKYPKTTQSKMGNIKVTISQERVPYFVLATSILSSSLIGFYPHTLVRIPNKACSAPHALHIFCQK